MNPSLIYHVTSSLDGYIARPDGRLDWIEAHRPADEEYSFQYFYSSIDALLMGRMTYEALMASGEPWPYPGKPCVVLTRMELARASAEVQLTHCTPAQAVAALRESGFQRIWLVGGGSLAGTCYTAGLLDEVVVNLAPYMLGAGIPLLASGLESGLTLIDQRRFNNGTIQLHYKVRGQQASQSDQPQDDIAA